MTMSCILRVNGAHLDIDSLVDKLTLIPDRIWHKGEPRCSSRPDARKNPNSGASFIASDADFHEFDRQVAEATTFLESFKDQILSVVSFDGVDHVALDFGIELRNVAIHCDFLNP
jgi:hypothetical protein